MSNKSKGSKAELEFKRILEARGYVVEKTRSGGRYGDKDFFNLFDLFALREDGGLLVQVKSNSTRGMIKKLKLFTKHPKCIKKVLAVRYDRGLLHPSKPVWRELTIEGDETNERQDTDIKD